jgi:hypothetical protein
MINSSVFYFSCLIIFLEVSLLVCFYEMIFTWLSHHWWLVILPFIKTIIKRVIVLNIISFFNALGILFWHLSKLALIKLFKTLGLRYGLFFSQYRWRFMRHMKVMFLRRGKQFFRRTARFWKGYSLFEKIIILIAFFPVALTLFLCNYSASLEKTG